MAKQIVNVQANFGTKKNPDVRTIKFKTIKGQVIVTVKGMPELGIVTEGKRVIAYMDGEATTYCVSAKTPEAAYKKAVKAFWN
jgi:hypothetical protein